MYRTEISGTTDSLPANLRRLFGHISPRRKRQLYLVLGLMLLGALAELVTLGTLLPFLALLADPDRAASYPTLQNAFAPLGWTDAGANPGPGDAAVRGRGAWRWRHQVVADLVKSAVRIPARA